MLAPAIGPNSSGQTAMASRPKPDCSTPGPKADPKKLARTAGGVGMSGVAVSGKSLCTLVQRDAQQWLLALDAQTGKQRWQTPLAPEYKNNQGDGPRATPTIRDKIVVAFTGQGILCAANLDDGKLLWSHDVVNELGGKVADYGMACSPLVAGDLVIVTAGAPQACVVAYQVQSGKLTWKSGSDPAGYSSPALLDVGGRRQIVVFTGSSVMGLVPESGAMLWRYPYETDYECNTATPVAVNGQVLVSAGENHGSVLLKLKPHGDKFDVEEAWSSQGPQSVLRSEWQTPIFLDGKLYGLDNSGSAGPITNLTCIDAATGRANLAAAAIWQVEFDLCRRQAVLQHDERRVGRCAVHAQGLRRNWPQTSRWSHAASRQSWPMVCFTCATTKRSSASMSANSGDA